MNEIPYVILLTFTAGANLYGPDFVTEQQFVDLQKCRDTALVMYNNFKANRAFLNGETVRLKSARCIMQLPVKDFE